MATVQINLKLPEKLFKVTKNYADTYGYRNVQELVYQSVREKVLEKGFDESFSEKEIGVIDKILEKSIKSRKLAGEEELRAALSKKN